MSADFDVVVVGAGIHGAGFAQAAAAAGHSVLVLEQRALASGSSSRSSKLIHGGLRYLESGQLRLVRESLHERTTLLRLAPELVRLQRFYIPVYRHTRRRPWQLLLGLSLYALLGGFGPGTGFGRLARREWPALDGLATRELQAVFWYQDAQTDDALLTAAVMRSAIGLGARLEMPAQFLRAELQDAGCELHYRAADGEHRCRARVLINAAGPWVSEVAQHVTPAPAWPRLQLVQGTHILLRDAPVKGVYYVESPRDGRAVFFMPWHGHCLVGTTELPFRGDPATVAPSVHERNYLLGVARHYFPKFRDPQASEVLDAFAGLRVLPAGSGHAFHRSRETLLLTDRERQPRLLSICGGKLTTWRAVSASALAKVSAALPARSARARTDQLPLRGA